MNCPNCAQDIQDGSDTCPYCQADVNNAVLDLEDDASSAGGLDDAMAALEENIDSGSPTDAAPQVIQEAIGDVKIPAAAPPPQKKYPIGLIVGACVLAGAYQFGLLDSLMHAAGMKSSPAEPAAIVKKPAAENDSDDEDKDDGPAQERDAEQSDAEESESLPAPDEPSASPSAAHEETPKPQEKAEPEPAKEVVLPQEWWFYGKTYDLLTLERVADVEMTFIGGQNDYSVKTNSKGEFQVKLPILEGGGYDLLIDRRGYSEGYLIDGKPSHISMPKAQRNRLWGAIPQKPKGWRGIQAKWKRRDLVLFPSLPGN